VSRGRRLWFIYGTLGVACAAAALALVATSDHEQGRVVTLVVGELIGLSFVFSGLYGAWRRPGNATGRILAGVGFAFYVGALAEANTSLVFTIGTALENLFLAVFVHLLLAYPTGTLATKLERRIVRAAYALSIVMPVLYLLVVPTPAGCDDSCPDNAFLVTDNHGLGVAVEVIASVSAAVVFGATLVLLVRRWRSASAAYRRSLRLVLLAGGTTALLFVVQVVLEPFVPHVGDIVLQTATGIAFLCVPFGFAAGLLRSRLAGAAVGRIVRDLGPTPAPGELRDALSAALHDPSLDVGYWLPELPGYVDIEGRPFDPEERGATTEVEGEEGTIGVLVHDPALRDEPELLDGVVAAARLALENERLHVELRTKISELERERDFTRLVVDTAPAYFCVVDASGRIDRFNATLSEVTGVTSEEVRGRFFWDVFTVPEEEDDVRSSLAMAAVAGHSEPREATLRSADGQLRTVLWSQVVIPEADSELGFMLVSGLDVTEQRNHEDALRRLADEQAALRRVATLVAAGPSEQELLESVASEVARLFDAEAAHMWQYEGEQARLVGGWNAPDPEVAADRFHVPEPDTIIGRIAATHQPARRDDYTGIGGVIGEIVRAAGIKTAIGAPVEVAGTLWGAIVVSKVHDDPFPEGSEHRLGAFAGLVAQAMANAEARRALASVAEEQAALRRVATLVARGGGEEELIAAVTKEAAQIFGAQSANTMRWDGESVRVIGGWSAPGARVPTVGRVFAAGGDTITARVVNSGRPVRVDSPGEIQSDIARELWDETGFQAAIGAPIVVDGRMWGVVVAFRDHAEEPFAPGAERRLGDFAGLVAQAIANAEARRELAVLAEEQAALRRVATLVAGGRPALEVLDVIATAVSGLFGAHAVHLVRWSGILDEVEIVGTWSDDGEPLAHGTRYRTASTNPTIHVLETGLVSTGREPAEIRAPGSHEWEAVEEHCVISAPVIVEATLWGALTAVGSAHGTFPPGAEMRLKSFASLLAQAIANSEAREALRASRARLVEAGDSERRKLERNLHDGAQQRLVAVSISLRLALAKLPGATDEARSLLASAADELTYALDELRELARGIHPAILTDRGLGPALEALAGRAPLPVDVAHDLEERLPEPVEAAAYYVVSESLTNVAKYAQASAVEVRVSRRNGVARVEVVDDGVGGADPTRGSGLRGLADRVEALDGRLGVESVPAAGTRVWAEIPVDS
jgi:PAS domain S-box-containing protein